MIGFVVFCLCGVLAYFMLRYIGREIMHDRQSDKDRKELAEYEKYFSDMRGESNGNE